MKFFPESNFSIELKNDSISSISELKKQTLSKEQFVVNWNNQAFIGKIQENEFEVTLSKKLLGEFCVLKGKLQNKKGTLQIQTNNIFKIIFSIIALFSLSGIITAIIQNKLEVVFLLIMAILIMRFIFLEFGFRLVSKDALNKLREILKISKIDKIA